MPRAPGLERKAAELTKKRLKGEAPPSGIVGRNAVPKKKKAVLHKTNSKGQVVAAKSHPSYYSMIKKCIKEHKERKGTTRQAIQKYIFSNYGQVNLPALKRALVKAVEEKKLKSAHAGRYSLTPKERKPKTAKKTRKVKKYKKKEKKDKKTTKKTKKTESTKKSKKDKSPKTAKRAAAPKAKASATTSSRVSKPKTATASTQTAATSSQSTGDLVWAWQYYDGGFHNYDENATDTVEGVYQEYLRSPYTCDVRAVKSGQWQYEIDFRLMTQRNIQHENHTTRRIRRIQVPASERTNRTKNYGGDEKYNSEINARSK